MEKLLKLEMVGLLLLSIFLFSETDFVWWWYLVLFLLPDIGMIGYLLNPKIGSYTYNLTHHFLVAVLLIMYGVWHEHPWIEIAGIVMLGHAAFDRVLGYGLKYRDSFKHTHLGQLK